MDVSYPSEMMMLSSFFDKQQPQQERPIDIDTTVGDGCVALLQDCKDRYNVAEEGNFEDRQDCISYPCHLEEDVIELIENDKKEKIIIEEEEEEGWKEDELFFGNWADEVEEEEKLSGDYDEPYLALSKRPRSSTSSLIRIGPSTTSKNNNHNNNHNNNNNHHNNINVNINNKKKKKQQKKKKNNKTKKSLNEYKLFVGGIIFADLEEHLFEMEDMIQEELEPEILFAALDTLKKLRIDCFESMFDEFGRVKRIKPNWEKRFCHVIYESEAEAFEAFQTLAKSEERKVRQKEFQDALEAAGFPRFAAPCHNFYVRWPRYQQQQQQHTQQQLTTTTTTTTTTLSACVVPVVEEEDRNVNDICFWMVSTSAEARWELLNVDKNAADEALVVLPKQQQQQHTQQLQQHPLQQQQQHLQQQQQQQQGEKVFLTSSSAPLAVGQKESEGLKVAPKVVPPSVLPFLSLAA